MILDIFTDAPPERLVARDEKMQVMLERHKRGRNCCKLSGGQVKETSIVDHV